MIGYKVLENRLRTFREQFPEYIDKELHINGERMYDYGTFSAYFEDPLKMFEHEDGEWKEIDVNHYYVYYSTSDDYKEFMKKYFSNRKFKRKTQELQTINVNLEEKTTELCNHESEIFYHEYACKRLKREIEDLEEKTKRT